MQIKGILPTCYILEELSVSWSTLTAIIPTLHAPELVHKCFGYAFDIDDTSVVYTGDTAILGPYLEYLSKGTELYIDISAIYGQVHIKYDDVADKLLELAAKGVKIYCMHVDNMEVLAEKIKDTPFEIVPCT